jgi:hypothetical protein
MEAPCCGTIHAHEARGYGLAGKKFEGVMTARFRINTPNVVAETVDGETTIVDLEKGVYYALNGSGSLIWDEVISGAPQAEVASVVMRTFGIADEEADRAVGDLVGQLAEAGLIVENGSPSTNGTPAVADRPAAAANGASTGYVEPKLSTYTDMQELLLLDPIHETDDAGWPSRP